MEKVQIIPDNSSESAIKLATTKKVCESDKIIFGTEDKISAKTMISDAKFVRDPSSQGVDSYVHVHGPVPLKGE